MNLTSCKECGVVMNLKKVKFIPTELPDNPEEKERDEYGDLLTENTHHNPDVIWERHNISPSDTWQCPICSEFNGVEEDN